MSKHLDATNISEIIRKATDKKIALTEDLTANASQETAEEHSVPVMVNGKEYYINADAYAAFKEDTTQIKKQMKSDLKAINSQFKLSVKESKTDS